MSNESITKTFVVAALLSIVCAIVVSLSDVSLKGLQRRNQALDKQLNILRAAGLVESDAKVSAEESERLFAKAKTVVVDLATGQIVPDADPDATLADKTNVVPLSKEEDLASIKTRPQRAVVYLFYDDAEKLQSVVLPIVGTGLWSTMRGFLSLNGDLATVCRIVFYEHGETPGLGGEISNPAWTSKWEGKSVYNASGEPVIEVVKGTVDPSSESASNQIDGISGATLTGAGVTQTVQFWLGNSGYGPYLEELRKTNGAASATHDLEDEGKDAQ